MSTQIKFKWLSLINFKGTRKQTIKFDDVITNIWGDNGTGKTTIADAVSWLFFGKDSIDRKDFDLKNTKDTSLNRQDHEVSAGVEINGANIVIKKVFREKWVKKKGAEESVFSGNETVCFWDEVPVSIGDFSKKISNVIDEKIFKLISNAAYFNSMKWQDRRQILFNIAGDVTNEEVAGTNAKFLEILSQLTSGKTLEEYKKQVASKRKKIKDELDQVPTRIDEVNKGIPEMGDPSLIRRAIKDKTIKIDFLDGQMADRSNSMNNAFEIVRAHQQQVFNLQSEMDSISNFIKQSITNKDQDIASERNQITREINSKEQEVKQIENQRDKRLVSLDEINSQIIEKRNLWVKINTERQQAASEKLEFDDSCDSCPTCKRLFSDGDIASKRSELLENFNKEKDEKVLKYANQLELIVSQADALNTEKDRIVSLDTSDEIAAIQKEIDDLKIQLSEFEKQFEGPGLTLEELLAENIEYQNKLVLMTTLNVNAPEEPKVDLTDLQNEKIELESEVRQLERELASEAVIKQSKLRIADLEAEEKRLAGELAQLEGQEFTIDAFTRKKVEEVESRINGLFKYVKFKMFDIQINGGETETCETMMDGVPYSVLNNGGRINAGLDIINALCKYYNVNAPIFIDNAESVTKLIDVSSQVVRLVVSESDKVLRYA